MRLHCYHISPIDFWAGALSVKSIVSALDDYECAPDHLASVLRHLAALEKLAQRGFAKIGWEGDTTVGPSYFALPGEAEFEFGYVLKQSNNGSTFVASPYPLPWLSPLTMVDPIVIDDEASTSGAR